jgi:hypothetical protein
VQSNATAVVPPGLLLEFLDLPSSGERAEAFDLNAILIVAESTLDTKTGISDIFGEGLQLEMITN